MSPITRLLITGLFGWLGIHRFLDRKTRTGIVWLLTLGVFGFGWLADTWLALTAVISRAGKDTGVASVPSAVGSAVTPKRDHSGRLIIRVAEGPQVSIPLVEIDDKDEDGRLDKYLAETGGSLERVGRPRRFFFTWSRISLVTGGASLINCLLQRALRHSSPEHISRRLSRRPRN